MTHEVYTIVAIDTTNNSITVNKKVLDETNNNEEISSENLTYRMANARDDEKTDYTAATTDSQRIQIIATMLDLTS